MSRSRTNRMLRRAWPSVISPAFISSMPAMLLMASSSGSTTAVAISDGLAPGSETEMLTVAGSAFGKRSTPRLRKEKSPSTTSSSTSIVAITGRRTHSSESMATSAWLFRRQARPGVHLHPVSQGFHVNRDDRFVGFHAADDLDPVAHAVAHFELPQRELLALDHEHAVDAVAVLQGRDRQGEHAIDPRGFDANARERTGLEQRAGVGHTRLECKRA